MLLAAGGPDLGRPRGDVVEMRITGLGTQRHQIVESKERRRVYPGRKSTTADSRLYMAPAILTAPAVSSSAMTALRLWIPLMVSSTFFPATASTKAYVFAHRSS